uniref:Globin domain-containing protein n=1 Tax=Sinocyclocheilus anshuiensis TaxID=1608454 RepID=A0A671RZ97_9TELE
IMEWTDVSECVQSVNLNAICWLLLHLHVFLHRCLIVYPWTQRYFGSFGSLSDTATIMANKKVAGMSCISVHSIPLKNNYYYYMHMVLLSTFNLTPLLGDCVTIVVASQLGRAFTPDIQAAWQKFLAVVVSALGKRYH